PSYTHSVFSYTAPATSQIYTLSLHDALPISTSSPSPRRSTPSSSSSTRSACRPEPNPGPGATPGRGTRALRHHPGNDHAPLAPRSEEHTSELQSRSDLVCRLLLEKKKKKNK